MYTLSMGLWLVSWIFDLFCVIVQGFVPGILGISHGALQFMAYEELKTLYNQWRKQPLDTRLVSLFFCLFVFDHGHC